MDLILTLFSIFAFLCTAQGYDRILESHVNPGCESCNGENVTLMYVKAAGVRDTVHNLWDFTGGKPTVILAVTEPNSTLSIHWNNVTLTPMNFTFSSPPKYSFGVVIDKIWEFNDFNNTGTFDRNTSQCRSYDTADMHWTRHSAIQEENQVMLEILSHKYGKDGRRGDVTIKLDLYPYSSYSFELPHLVHTANSSLIDIVLENMTTSDDYRYSRFAVELVVIGTDEESGTMTLTERKGLDDEHTPGVFEIVELITPRTASHENGGFLQYRPISYVHPLREVSSSTKVSTNPLMMTNLPTNTTADRYFKGFGVDSKVLSESFTVSMGDKDDGFYKKTNYSIWCFTAGYGKPPSEGFSLLVILILSIGLGIPFLLLFIGGVYVCAKRYAKRRNEHNILQEE